MKTVWEMTEGRIAVSIYANDKNDRYPVAECYATPKIMDVITIAAVSGMLSAYSERCDSCLKPGAHGLSYGPVDTLFVRAGYGPREDGGIKFHRFTVEDLRKFCIKYLSIDPGPAPK
jgi:hypothetical protein